MSRTGPAPAAGWRYVIALGSNRRHGRHGAPAQVLAAAVVAMAAAGCEVLAVAPVVASAPLGPSRRVYANGAAVIACAAPPDVVLARLKRIEADFGRRRGQRWAARVLDLDVILWSGGRWASGRRSVIAADGARWPGWLVVPHPAGHRRGFVLGPAACIAPRWRDPRHGRTLRQLAAQARAGKRPG